MSRIRRSLPLILAVTFAGFYASLILFFICQLPDISALDSVAVGEPVTTIRTIGGRRIYDYKSPTYGEKTAIPLSEVSDELIALTITTEDRDFFINPGFSPAAILRAFYQNLMLRQTFSGASTITQQVVRNIILSPDERYNRSFSRKAKEIFLSFLVTLRYDKETILEIYLNEIYYGQNATGVEKAAKIYFGKHASDLDLSEAAFIAGLPQAPNYYGIDPRAGSRRQREVLRILERIVDEDRCIPVSAGPHPRYYCPTPEDIRSAGENFNPLQTNP